MKIDELKSFLNFLPDEMPVIIQDEKMYNKEGTKGVMTYRPLSYIEFSDICEYGTDTTGDVYIHKEQDKNKNDSFRVLGISWYGENAGLKDVTVGKLLKNISYYSDDLELYVSDMGSDGFYRPIRSFEFTNISIFSEGSSSKIFIKSNEKLSELSEENLVISLSWEHWQSETIQLLEKLVKNLETAK